MLKQGKAIQSSLPTQAPVVPLVIETVSVELATPRKTHHQGPGVPSKIHVRHHGY